MFKRREKVAKIDEAFIEKNKKVLMEEMADNINAINSLISAATQAGPTEDPAHELSIVKNVIIAIAQNTGALTSCYNQFMIFETGSISEERLIGFQSLLKPEDD
jgi:hypothetical protein